MPDPRQLRTALTIARELGVSELEITEGDLHLKVSFKNGPEAAPVQVKRPTLAELIKEHDKRRQPERPAIESLAEKTPVFDFGLKT